MINPERAGIEDDSMIVGFVSLVMAFTRYQVPDTGDYLHHLVGAESGGCDSGKSAAQQLRPHSCQ
jgi:hypothetical protein